MKISCSKCQYWKRDLKWKDEAPTVSMSEFYNDASVLDSDGRKVPFTMDKDKVVITPRKMGECHLNPPEICAVLIPTVIKLKGFERLRQYQERVQVRPIMEAHSICGQFERKGKKNEK